MSVMKGHVDDFVLLRCAAGDLAEDEATAVTTHVASCVTCRTAVSELETLDRELHRLVSAGGLANDSQGFEPGDRFRHRPRLRKPVRVAGDAPLTEAAIAASERGLILQERLREAVRNGEGAFPAEIHLAEPEHRFALLYALQQAGREIAEDPVRTLGFAQVALRELQRENGTQADPTSPAERMVSRDVLRAQAHLLTAMACMWTKDFTRARKSLLVAYRAFARAGGDEAALAHVELVEAQRRAFVHESESALTLARRAEATFESHGLEDLAARAIGAQGLAYSDLGQEEDALAAFRKTLPIYDRYQLWSNYVGVLNSIGTSLTKLGRVDEARREYARALRRFSQEKHRYWLGYIRTGLAEILLTAGRFADAAVSAARAAQVFRDCGLRANALIASLLEIESWARHGSIGRARHRLELFEREVTRDGSLDAAVLQDFSDALSGANPDFERLSDLRQQAEALLHRRAGGRGH
jgi:tetratricopeptide (TPR) repeat protein